MKIVSGDEYMSKVKWVTFWYFAASVGSLLVGGAFGVAAIKGDILQSRQDSKDQIVSVYNRLDKKIDSAQYKNDLQFQAIWNELKNKTGKFQGMGYFTERYVNGKLVLIPVH